MRRMHGSVRYNPPSRFLSEIPDEFGIGRAPARPPGFPPLRTGTGVRGVERLATVRGEPRVDYSEAQLPPDEAPPISHGTRVEHPVFGAGTIVEVAGGGPNTKLRIRFDRAGVKTIVLRYAQLRLLD